MKNDEWNKRLNEIANRRNLDFETVNAVFWQLHEYHKDIIYDLNQQWIQPLLEGLDLETATGFYLNAGAASWNGLERHLPVRTQGKLLITASRAFNLPEGTIFRSVSGVEFATTQSTYINPPSMVVEIEANEAGIRANLPAGTELLTDRVFIGFEKASLPAGWIKREGKNEESDAELRNRVKDRFAMDTTGDISVKFIAFAMTIEGMRDVVVWRTPRGAGSMDVVVASLDGEVTERILREVREILEDRFLIAWDMGIIPAQKKSLDIKLVINDPSLSESVVKELTKQYILSLPIAGVFKPKDLYIHLGYGVNVLSPTRDTKADQYSEWTPYITFEEAKG